jgi:hypothetical protein
MKKQLSDRWKALLPIWLLLFAVGITAAAAQYSDSGQSQTSGSTSDSARESRSASVPQSGPNRNVGETVVVPRDRPTRPTPRVQEKVAEPVNPDETFRFSTEVDVVNLSVVVQDRNGNFIPELKREHFRILEDGKPQQIQRIERSEAPMTVAMVIEFSDLYWEFLWQTLQASYGFVSTLRPEDWVAVVVYDLKTVPSGRPRGPMSSPRPGRARPAGWVMSCSARRRWRRPTRSTSTASASGCRTRSSMAC